MADEKSGKVPVPGTVNSPYDWQVVSPKGMMANKLGPCYRPVHAKESCVNKVTIPDVFYREASHFKVGKVSRGGGQFQLLLSLPVEFSDGTVKKLKVLVDTGAEANLIKKGIMPMTMLYKSANPLTLVAANGGKIDGGERCCKLNFYFRQEVDGENLPYPLSKNAEFYEANIGLDAILSYPWLEENKIGIFPHHGALAVDKPQFTLLFPTKKNYSWPKATEMSCVETCPQFKSTRVQGKVGIHTITHNRMHNCSKTHARACTPLPATSTTSSPSQGPGYVQMERAPITLHSMDNM